MSPSPAPSSPATSPTGRPASALCLDCGARPAPGARRCHGCGGPRLVSHPELETLTIAHVDCDAFYAAIEKRDDPGLADKPVIVGGGRRGVVATACYIARIHGVRSAMPMFQALQRCPDAVVIRPDMARYSAVGRQIRERMRALTPLVEPVSIDEAFLDLGGTARLHGASPAALLARLARDIERELGITVSVGLSDCKFLAKLASEMDKPRGFSVIGRAEAREVLRERPVSAIWGVGRAMQAKLAADGISLVGQLQDRDEAALMRLYGSMGQRLSRLSRGLDTRAVEPEGEARSVSAETTFDVDRRTGEALLPALRRLSERVSSRLKAQDLAGQTVTLKLKTTSFRQLTRSRTLPHPTQLADRIHATAASLLAPELDGTAYRLIGVGVSMLGPDDTADPADLLDEAGARRARAELAIDRVRARYGDGSVALGLTLGEPSRRR